MNDVNLLGWFKLFFLNCVLFLTSHWQWAVRLWTWLCEEMDWDNWASMFAWMALSLRSNQINICCTKHQTWLHITGMFKTLWFSPTGGGIRLCLAGRTEAGQSVGGDLQGGRSDADSRADDRSAADIGHGQSGHHSSLRRGGASQVL